VIGKGKFERIIGTHLGGGTILGLARLLTGCARYCPIKTVILSNDFIFRFETLTQVSCSSYDEFLELSQRGNNLSVDLTVGDIYGELGYPKV